MHSVSESNRLGRPRLAQENDLIRHINLKLVALGEPPADEAPGGPSSAWSAASVP